MHYRKSILCLFLALLLSARYLLLPAAAKTSKEPLPTMQNGVPVYFQTDYPHIRYGDGNMATSGCGPTSLSMVATYLTGYDYTPDRIAGFFMGGENNVIRLEYGSDQLNLPWRKAVDFYDAYEALKQGDVAIAMMGPESYFTTSQHFLVMAGVTEDGRILINDPMKPHYSNGVLDWGLRHGLKPGEVLRGFCGAWVYDVSAMDTPQYRHEEAYRKPRYPWESLSDRDRTLLAAYLQFQAEDRTRQCQQAIAEVLLNRMAYWMFSDTLEGVLYTDGLLKSALDDMHPTQEQYDAVDRAFQGPYLLPPDVVYYGSAIPNGNICRQFDGMTFCYPEIMTKKLIAQMNELFQATITPKWNP